MARIRHEPIRARSSRSASPLPAYGDSDATWVDLGGHELRLRGDAGQVMWSAALPDPHAVLARLEFGERDLESLGYGESNEGSGETGGFEGGMRDGWS